MKRARSRAFTLVELLVVIVIIAILVALLMPAFSSAWGVLNNTNCQAELKSLWRIQGAWAADRMAATGGRLDQAWTGSITPYLEKTLLVPCDQATYLPQLPPVVSVNSLALSDVSIGFYRDPNSPTPDKQVHLGVPGEWDWYQTWTNPDGSLHIDCNLDGNYNQKAWPNGVQPPNLVQIATGNGSGTRWNNTSFVPANGMLSDNDFTFTVTYDNAHNPTAVTIGDCDGNGDSMWTDFEVKDKPQWGGEKFKLLFGAGHVGDVVTMISTGVPITSWTIWSSVPAYLGQLGYGISRGSYLDDYGNLKSTPDPRLFFILDYAKGVADFTNIVPTASNPQETDVNYWSSIFITQLPPLNWTVPVSFPPPADPNQPWTWQQAQALRHTSRGHTGTGVAGGTVNVLFCDGHVENLAEEDFTTTTNGTVERGAKDRLWRYGESRLPPSP